MMSLGTERPAEFGARERLYEIPPRTFKVRERLIVCVDAVNLTAQATLPPCPGARFRVEQILVPSSIAYRFAVGLVVDGDAEQKRDAKKFPWSAMAFSEVAVGTRLMVPVKRRFELYVIRRAIRPWWRFLNEEADPKRHFIVDTVRPLVKEPPIVAFAGSVRLLMAPPNGWN
jgi:hypothetical protein